MTLSGYRGLPGATLEAAEMWGKIRPLHLHSITVGPLLIDPSEVLQAGFVLLFYQLSASVLAPTKSAVFIMSY
jgi:hypothetical protein